MDRRQRKTREAVLNAFTELLLKKHYEKITVGEIIERADVGRATFYAHFQTKDYLLKELLDELFCHVFDAAEEKLHDHKHVFHCEGDGSVFLHLLKHLEKNDKGILTLLVGPNNELFVRCFKKGLEDLIEKIYEGLEITTPPSVPKNYVIKILASGFLETVKFWAETQKTRNSAEIADCFYKIFGIGDASEKPCVYNNEDKK